MIKKVHPARPQIAWLILKGETIVDARSILPVREHGKVARTPPCLFHPVRWAICFQHSLEGCKNGFRSVDILGREEKRGQ
jgi:hypothetical protein